MYTSALRLCSVLQCGEYFSRVGYMGATCHSGALVLALHYLRKWGNSSDGNTIFMHWAPDWPRGKTSVNCRDSTMLESLTTKIKINFSLWCHGQIRRKGFVYFSLNFNKVMHCYIPDTCVDAFSCYVCIYSTLLHKEWPFLTFLLAVLLPHIFFALLFPFSFFRFSIFLDLFFFWSIALHHI